MGRWFIWYALASCGSVLAYGLLAPETFRDFPDIAAFAGWRGQKVDVAADVWYKANRHKNPKRRIGVVLLGIVAIVLFVLFLYSCFQFLTHSLDCRAPSVISLPTPPHKSP